jgi:hypothetical protein
MLTLDQGRLSTPSRRWTFSVAAAQSSMSGRWERLISSAEAKALLAWRLARSHRVCSKRTPKMGGRLHIECIAAGR